MESETGVTRSIIEEIHSSDILRTQMEPRSGVTRSIIVEIHYLDMQGKQM